MAREHSGCAGRRSGGTSTHARVLRPTALPPAPSTHLGRPGSRSTRPAAWWCPSWASAAACPPHPGMQAPAAASARPPPAPRLAAPRPPARLRLVASRGATASARWQGGPGSLQPCRCNCNGSRFPAFETSQWPAAGWLHICAAGSRRRSPSSSAHFQRVRLPPERAARGCGRAGRRQHLCAGGCGTAAAPAACMRSTVQALSAHAPGNAMAAGSRAGGQVSVGQAGPVKLQVGCSALRHCGRVRDGMPCAQQPFAGAAVHAHPSRDGCSSPRAALSLDSAASNAWCISALSLISCGGPSGDVGMHGMRAGK